MAVFLLAKVRSDGLRQGAGTEGGSGMGSIMENLKNRLGIFFFKLFCPMKYECWTICEEETENIMRENAYRENKFKEVEQEMTSEDCKKQIEGYERMLNDVIEMLSSAEKEITFRKEFPLACGDIWIYNITKTGIGLPFLNDDYSSFCPCSIWTIKGEADGEVFHLKITRWGHPEYEEIFSLVKSTGHIEEIKALDQIDDLKAKLATELAKVGIHY